MAGVEEVRFVGVGGGRLAGVLHEPEGRARGSVLLVHCFTCSKDLHTMTRLAKGLAAAGYAAFRFDFTGLGESAGDFSETTVSTNVGDLTRAAATLIERGYGPCGIVGHSLGGAAALLAAERLRTVRSVAVLGAPATPGHLRRLFVDAEPAEDGDIAVTIGGRPFTVGRELLDDLDRHDSDDRIASLGRPLLVLHAVDDAIVPIGEGERIFARAAQPKGFLPLLGTDHLVSDRPSAERVLGAVVAWFDATL